MAEAQGFEPWGRFHARRFSRPVHSTTLPNLRLASDKPMNAILKACFGEKLPIAEQQAFQNGFKRVQLQVMGRNEPNTRQNFKTPGRLMIPVIRNCGIQRQEAEHEQGFPGTVPGPQKQDTA